MANFLFSKFIDLVLTKQIDMTKTTGDTFRAMLVTSDYVPDKDADDFLDTVETGWRAGASSATGRANGIAVVFETPADAAVDCANIVFTSISATPDPVEYNGIIIYQDDGSADATSPLVAYVGSATGLPVTSNGDDISLIVPAAGLFEIVN